MNYYVIAAVFVLLMVLIKLLMKQNRKRCMNSSCLIGKTAIVTGGNSGKKALLFVSSNMNWDLKCKTDKPIKQHLN